MIRLNKISDKNSKLNDEKRLTELIKKICEKNSPNKENIPDLIGGNFSIAKQQIKEVKKDVLDLRKSI